MESGWFDHARRELRQGRNPGIKGWDRVLCAALLKGGVSRAEFQLALCSELRLKESSAKTQASNAIAVFSAGGLMAIVDEKIAVRLD